MQRWVSNPMAVPEHEYLRADLEFEGVEHRGDSYVIRVYLNNPRATAGTGDDPAAGYAGHVTVFAHGECWGEEGHCDVVEPVSPFDRTRPHPLTPVNLTLTITDALRRVEPGPLRVTALAFPAGPDPASDARRRLMSFAELTLLTYS
jgi:hypothetical protein